DTLKQLSQAYQRAGQPRKALELSEEMLNARRAKAGEDTPDLLRNMNDLAAQYWLGAGDLDKAILLFEQTLVGRREKLGADHAFTLITLRNLALAWQAKKHPDKAEPLWRELLQARQ